MIEQSIQELIQYGIEKELITSEDEIFLRNQLMDLLQLSAWETPALPEVSVKLVFLKYAIFCLKYFTK